MLHLATTYHAHHIVATLAPAELLLGLHRGPLVDLDVPLARVLQPLEHLRPVDAAGGGDGLEGLCDSGHHPLKATEVDVGAVVEAVEELL